MREYPIFEHVFENGLRLIVSEDGAAPVAAVNFWYHVGSRNEQPGRTGLAHLFEHLMFEGSRQVEPSEHFSIVTHAGGSTNASTSMDRTNYFETVPVDQLDVALWLEADRLGSLLEVVTEESLEKQRDIVKNERRQRYEVSPYGSTALLMPTALFPPEHPYSHAPIGSMEDLSAATLDDVRSFFRTYYAPNNLVVTVVGAVDPADVVKRVQHYFEGIPANDSIPPAPSGTLEQPLTQSATTVLTEPVPDRAVFMGFRLPPEGDERLDHLEVARSCLAMGRGSRFHQRVVRKQMAKQASLSIQRLEGGASYAIVTAIAHPAVSNEELEGVLRNELAELAEYGPTDEEIVRAKTLFQRGWLELVSDVEKRADELSRAATLFGDAIQIERQVDRMVATSAEDLQSATKAFLVDAAAATFWYEPATPGGNGR